MKALAAQMQKDNAEFKAQMTKDNAEFKAQITARLDAFEAKTDSRFDKLEASVGVMQNDLVGLKHDVAGLYHWDYWLLSIILVVFAMPQIVAGLKALFGAVTEGIADIIAVFRDRGGGGA